MFLNCYIDWYMDPAAQWRSIQRGCGEMRWQTRKHLNSVQRCTCKHATWFIQENIGKHYTLRFCVRRCYTDFWKYHLDILFQMFDCNMVRLCKCIYVCEMISTDFQKLNPIYQQYLHVQTCHMNHPRNYLSLDVTQNIWRKSLYCVKCLVAKWWDCYMISTNLPKYYSIFQQYLNRVMLVHVQTCEMIHPKAANIWTLYQVVQGKKCTRRKRGEINFLLVAEHWKALKKANMSHLNVNDQ